MKIEKLRNVSALITKGTTPTTLGYEFVDKGVPFIRVNNLSDSTVNFKSNILYISEHVHNLLNRSKIQPQDLVISIAGTVGRVAMVPDQSPEMNCNQAVAIIRLKGGVDKRYVLHWLNSNEAIKQIQQGKVTATISNLSLSQLGALDIPLPPLEEQKRIAAILDQADFIRQKHLYAAEKAKNLLSTLSHSAFNGEL